mgnify:CR=1 FL=1
MVEPLYVEDPYLKEFEAKVTSADGKFIVLDRTAFYPNAGGQPNDTGKLVRASDDKEFSVVYVAKVGDKISHEISEPGLEEGDQVKGYIDWERRHLLMRMHTAAHLLSRVIYDDTGATTSGNQLGTDRSRIDFTLQDFDKEKAKAWVEMANKKIADIPVKRSYMDREETEKIDGFAAPSPHLKQEMETLRVIDIEGIDIQPCGGTHLDNLNEIGKIEFVKAENKGKGNRRIYYAVSDL